MILKPGACATYEDTQRFLQRICLSQDRPREVLALEKGHEDRGLADMRHYVWLVLRHVILTHGASLRLSSYALNR
jgi:hypothetical protein